MSVGLNFLHAIIANSEPRLLRRVRPEMFTEDELGVYEFVSDYHSRYRQLPPHEIIEEEGLRLPSPRRVAAPDYWLDAVKRRYAYQQINERHPQLVQAMQGRDIERAVNVVKEMASESALAMGSENYSTLQSEVAAIRQDYEWARRNPGLRGIPTGWPTLDLATLGMQGSDVIVIAGRPSMGKSYLLMEMANASHLDGNSIAVVSMEMSRQQLVRRWIGRRSGFNPNLIRSGELGTYSHRRLLSTMEELENDEVPIYLMAGDMRKHVDGVEAMVAEFNPQALFVDAAYLLTPSGRQKGYISKWESISEVICELKQMAIRYDIPVVISVQFNRNQKNKAKKEMDLSDIAGSDSIPQDASVVLGVQQGPAPFQSTTRVVEVLKNREGTTPRFATSFTFNPVSMVEIPLIDEEDDSTEVVNVDYME